MAVESAVATTEQPVVVKKSKKSRPRLKRNEADVRPSGKEE